MEELAMGTIDSRKRRHTCSRGPLFLSSYLRSNRKKAISLFPAGIDYVVVKRPSILAAVSAPFRLVLEPPL
jgi:hypothetical protein